MARPVRESLNEAKLNLPQEYIDKIRGEASENIGLGGPSRQDMMQMQRLIGQIFQIQRGHEDELTEVGINVIRKFYGPVIDGVDLDVKIVDPDDEEKLAMATKMLGEMPEQEENEDEDEGYQESPPVEVELELPGIEDDIDKRKLINNIMQGEAQNVHDMMYDVRDEVTEITGSAELLDMYMEFLALNRKFDWDERINLEQMMQQAPQMANAMETTWKGGEEGEEGEEREEGEKGEGDTPGIKARVLDLPMLVHETVKGIYELIAAGAIDPDPIRAQKVLAATDSLDDEQEDIRFGPFIARDIRNYINKVADTVRGAYDIPNMREFIFGKLMTIPSTEFVQLITAMVMDEDGPAETIASFIKEIQEEFAQHAQTQMPGYDEDEDEDEDEDLPAGVEEFPEEEDDEDNELLRMMKGGGGNAPKAPEAPEEDDPRAINNKLASMGKTQLNREMNIAIDSENWEYAKQIQAMMTRKGLVEESLNNTYNELWDEIDK